MPRTPSRRVKRTGFTLLEMVVVLAIILALVSLLMAAVVKARAQGQQVQTRTEIGELETAVQNVVQTYHVKFVPSSIKLSEQNNYPQASTPGTADYFAVNYLQRMFGKRINLASGGWIDWNGNGVKDADVTLEGEECLVFFLGGIPTTTGGNLGCTGFSTDATNPASTTVPHKPPAFTFQTSRLVLSPRAPGFLRYLDPYKKQPYLYFSSYYRGNDYQSGDCASFGVTPYVGPSGRFVNPYTFQIVSAGRNGLFGVGGSTWDPLNGTSDPNALDDQANFSPYVLGVGQN